NNRDHQRDTYIHKDRDFFSSPCAGGPAPPPRTGARAPIFFLNKRAGAPHHRKNRSFFIIFHHFSSFFIIFHHFSSFHFLSFFIICPYRCHAESITLLDVNDFL